MPCKTMRDTFGCLFCIRLQSLLLSHIFPYFKHCLSIEISYTITVQGRTPCVYEIHSPNDIHTIFYPLNNREKAGSPLSRPFLMTSYVV